jgi:hypothetical protein
MPADYAEFADFCRQRAGACFHRRRDYALGSDERRRLMDKARRYIRSQRAVTCRMDRRRTIPKDKLTAASGVFERPAATLEFELSDAAVTRFVGARQAVLL